MCRTANLEGSIDMGDKRIASVRQETGPKMPSLVRRESREGVNAVALPLESLRQCVRYLLRPYCNFPISDV